MRGRANTRRRCFGRHFDGISQLKKSVGNILSKVASAAISTASHNVSDVGYEHGMVASAAISTASHNSRLG